MAIRYLFIIQNWWILRTLRIINSLFEVFWNLMRDYFGDRLQGNILYEDIIWVHKLNQWKSGSWQQELSGRKVPFIFLRMKWDNSSMEDISKDYSDTFECTINRPSQEFILPLIIVYRCDFSDSLILLCKDTYGNFYQFSEKPLLLLWCSEISISADFHVVIARNSCQHDEYRGIK